MQQRYTVISFAKFVLISTGLISLQPLYTIRGIGMKFFPISKPPLALSVERQKVPIIQNSTKTPRPRTSSKESLVTFRKLSSSLECEKGQYRRNSTFQLETRYLLSEEQIINRTSHCSNYFSKISSNGFRPITKEEEETPLAFSFLAHKQIGILEIFMALYFRPTDAYCIHVDAKASTIVLDAVKGIVNCYNEAFPESVVFIPRHVTSVYWGKGGSILEADWICYRELAERSKKWKYVSNMAASELPFVSIQRFRQKLKEAGGNVMVIGTNKHLQRQKRFWVTTRYVKLFDSKCLNTYSDNTYRVECRKSINLTAQSKKTL